MLNTKPLGKVLMMETSVCVEDRSTTAWWWMWVSNRCYHIRSQLNKRLESDEFIFYQSNWMYHLLLQRPRSFWQVPKIMSCGWLKFQSLGCRDFQWANAVIDVDAWGGGPSGKLQGMDLGEDGGGGEPLPLRWSLVLRFYFSNLFTSPVSYALLMHPSPPKKNPGSAPDLPP